MKFNAPIPKEFEALMNGNTVQYKGKDKKK